MNSSEEIGYDLHLWAREVGSFLNIPLLYLSSAGQYRVNSALFRDQPTHPVFANERVKVLYEAKRGLSRLLQTCFIPKRWQNSFGSTELQALRQSGSGLQAVAGYGLQIPSLFRLGMNAKVLLDVDFWNSKTGTVTQQAAVLTDTLSLATGLIQIQSYNRALGYLHQGEEKFASGYFIQNHRLHLASSGFQMIAGLLRLNLEFEIYSKTGELRPWNAFFGLLDSAAGVAGIIYSQSLLLRSQGVQVDERNNLLMGLTPLPARLRWGLRGLSLIGNLTGVGLSLWSFVNSVANKSSSEKVTKNKIITTGLNVISSVLMTGAGFFGQTAVTAPFSGLLMMSSFGVMMSQTFWRE